MDTEQQIKPVGRRRGSKGHLEAMNRPFRLALVAVYITENVVALALVVFLRGDWLRKTRLLLRRRIVHPRSTTKRGKINTPLILPRRRAVRRFPTLPSPVVSPRGGPWINLH